MSTPKVLYIAGAARIGSTILDQLLGELPGFVSTGELQMIWQRGLIEGQVCGCGAPLPECDFWRAVMSDAFGDLGSAEPGAVLAMLGPYVPASPWRLARLRRDSVNAQRGRANSGAAQYARVMERLYSSIGRVADARVIVDSSKSAVGAFIAASLVGVEVYLLHLLRDPRAVVYSWERNSRPGEVVPAPDRRTPIGLKRTLAVSLDWLSRNGSIELVRPPQDRVMRMRYEDFAAKPNESLERICRFVQGPSPARPLVSREGVATVHDNHIACGNRSRFLRGDVSILRDDEWRSAISRRGAVSSTVFALPLARRYGYPVLSR